MKTREEIIAKAKMWEETVELISMVNGPADKIETARIIASELRWAAE